MKGIFFDSSTLISLATTCTLKPFEKLANEYDGDFYITPTVYKETIEKAAVTPRFMYEGYRLKQLLKKGTLKIYKENKYNTQIKKLSNLSNNTFLSKKHSIHIVHPGEISIVVLARETNSNIVGIDERTTRLLIEDTYAIKELMQHRLHQKISANKDNISQIQDYLDGMRVIRSTELAVAAFQKGYLGNKSGELLKGILWAMKLDGCAISSKEIKSYLHTLLK